MTAAVGTQPDAVVLDGVTKSFPRRDGAPNRQAQRSLRRGEEAVDRGVVDLTLRLAAGEAVGVLGRPGSGRSTLLGLIAGTYRADTGTVRVLGRPSGLAASGVGFVRSARVGENLTRSALMLGMTSQEAEELTPRIAELAGVEHLLRERLSEISRTKARLLAYTVALHAPAEVFLVDEEVVTGNEEFREMALGMLEGIPAQGRCLVVVTNNGGYLRRLCTRAVVLEEGRLDFEGAVGPAIKRLRRKGQPEPEPPGREDEDWDDDEDDREDRR